MIVGMTGSGKTGLAVSLIEEAAIDGVPAILIDPKGDLANLLLQFPELRPADFRPWIDEDEARRKGLSPDELAAKTAETWRKGLAKWDEDGEYHSYSGAQYLLFVPYTNKILEKTGIVLEAMMGISEYTLKDVYIEEMLGQIYSRTPEASEMLYDYILPNTLYDMGGRQGLSFNNLIPLVQAVPLGMTDIKSLVDPVADTIQLTIDNVNDFKG